MKTNSNQCGGESKPATQKQVQYALERVRDIARGKRCILDKELEQLKEVSFDDMVAAILSGKAKLSRERVKHMTRYTDVVDVFIFPEDKATEKVRAKIQARRTALCAEETRICDRLVLGDASAALSAIEAFAAKEF